MPEVARAMFDVPKGLLSDVGRRSLLITSIKMSEDLELDPKTKAVFDRKGYKVMKKISQGAFGKVYKAKRTETGTLSAVKVMDMSKMPKKFVVEFLPRELEMLQRIKNPNVLKVFDIFKSKGKIWIFMEFAGGGTLTAQCISEPIPERKCKKWFKQIAEAVKYMHFELKICHRDIKTDNVLLDEEGDAKLSDFGFARTIEQSSGMVNTVCGTLPYYSPELVKAAFKQGIPYGGYAADDWAMGVMLYAMLTSKFAFKCDPKSGKEGLKKMYQDMKSRVYQEKPNFQNLPEGARHLIDHLLDPDPKTRYTSRKYVRHPWLTNSE